MIEISITTDRVLLDQVEQTLADFGAQSVTLRDAADDPVLEPLPGETPLWSQVLVTALFSSETEIDALKQALQPFINRSELKVVGIAQQGWVWVYLNNFKPRRFGRRLRICCSNQAPDATAVDIQLDPGLAFGTGNHATTALCLEWLDANPPIGRIVIDYGCGSGILAIAAIKLGARYVHAVDIDPQALLATGDNAARNSVSPNQLVICRPDDPLDLPADILVANILARPLTKLAENLAQRVNQAGQIVLSGVLHHQADELIAVYAPWFNCVRTRDKDGWALMEGTKR